MTIRRGENHPAASLPAPEYGEAYFSDYGGVSYADASRWMPFFAEVAEHIVSEIQPKTTLDVGCATGYLVEALRDRGVKAQGIDISDYAITNAREAVRDYCNVGSILEPFQQTYDLITCIEVVEHLPVEEAERAIRNLCDHTDDILFTSTPHHYGEDTHFNVRPPEYWTELFARNGFYRDVDFEAPYLAAWAARYRRIRDPLPRVLAAYERVLWRLRYESSERNQLIVKQMDDVNQGRAARIESEHLVDEIAALRRELSEVQIALEKSETATRMLRIETNRVSATAVGRLTVSLQDRAQRFAPPGTRRRRWLRNLVRGSADWIQPRPRPR
jgi:SAM-dependent methyltransferase